MTIMGVCRGGAFNCKYARVCVCVYIYIYIYIYIYSKHLQSYTHCLVQNERITFFNRKIGKILPNCSTKEFLFSLLILDFQFIWRIKNFFEYFILSKKLNLNNRIKWSDLNILFVQPKVRLRWRREMTIFPSNHEKCSL